MVEVSIGIVVASLPPLRKSFDSLLKHITFGSLRSKLFSGNKSSSGNRQSFNLPSTTILIL
jgi:hypothetical protein